LRQKYFVNLREKLNPLLLIAVLAIVFYPSIVMLFESWIRWDEGLSHGLPVIGIFIYFVYASSPWLALPQRKFMYFCSLACILMLSIFWFLAKSINIFILEQLTLIPMLFLLVGTCYGWRTSVQYKMLLAMPIFAIPVWDSFNGVLVNLSGLAVGVMVKVVKMAAVIDGNSIYLPYGQILIADGCSGIRYFIISLALGYIMSYLNGYKGIRLLLVMAAALVLGLAANWVRIFSLVVIGYQTKMQSSLMTNHEYFGWALFAVIALPAIYFAPAPSSVLPASVQANHNRVRLKNCLAPLLVMCVGPMLSLLINQKVEESPLANQLNRNYSPLMHETMPLDVLSPSAQHVEMAKLNNIYLRIDQYQRLSAHEKLVPYVARLYNNDLWTMQLSDTFEASGLNAALAVFKNKSTGQNVAQLQWFQLHNRATSRIIFAKLLQVPALVLHQNHFMIVTMQAECGGLSCDLAMAQLKQAAPSVFNDVKRN
jgi:exosortase